MTFCDISSCSVARLLIWQLLLLLLFYHKLLMLLWLYHEMLLYHGLCLYHWLHNILTLHYWMLIFCHGLHHRLHWLRRIHLGILLLMLSCLILLSVEMCELWTSCYLPY